MLLAAKGAGMCGHLGTQRKSLVCARNVKVPIGMFQRSDELVLVRKLLRLVDWRVVMNIIYQVGGEGQVNDRIGVKT